MLSMPPFLSQLSCVTTVFIDKDKQYHLTHAFQLQHSKITLLLIDR